MGPTMSPIPAQTGYSALEQIPPVGHIKRTSNKNIVFAAPKVVLWFDSCEYGILGYN